MDSVSTTPPAILDYSLPSLITDQGVSCHTMTTLGYCDTVFSPGTLSSPVLSDHMSSDSDSDSSDTGYVCTSLRCEYGYCGHKPASDKEVHEAECLYWCRKCTFYLCCECMDPGRRGSRGGWSRRTPPLWLRGKKKKKIKKGSLNVAFYVILWIDVPQLTMPKCNNFIIRLLKL